MKFWNQRLADQSSGPVDPADLSGSAICGRFSPPREVQTVDAIN
jgi:hypothetical protein